ncbi:hypothetical protein [uncultured Maricaulis sp.]|uniref:hypothetical protein n=1 Tax=uncultured Maricaulis sp. TaxID=174710 RepID=UPI0030DBCE8C|tara:strand:- start:91935 stop:92405 length:471 start_codon:yes stop_codon:yes gene_type:complete
MNERIIDTDTSPGSTQEYTVETEAFYNSQRLQFAGLFVTSAMLYSGGALATIIGIYGEALAGTEGSAALRAAIDIVQLRLSMVQLIAAAISVIGVAGFSSLSIAMWDYSHTRRTRWQRFVARAGDFMSWSSFAFGFIGFGLLICGSLTALSAIASV